MTIKKICPRCLNYIPSNDKVGLYPGAVSRTDNKTEICSFCGTEEAFEFFFDGIKPQKTEWPIVEWFDYEKTFYVSGFDDLFNLTENILENLISKKNVPQSIKDLAQFHLATLYKQQSAEERSSYALVALADITPKNYKFDYNPRIDNVLEITFSKIKKEQKA